MEKEKPRIDENALFQDVNFGDVNDPYASAYSMSNPYGIDNPYATVTTPTESSPYSGDSTNNTKNYSQPYSSTNQADPFQQINSSTKEDTNNDDGIFDEIEAQRYYCEEKPLHNLPHPLQLLEKRKPGVDQRASLSMDHGKIDLYSNVVFVGNLPDGIDEMGIAKLFQSICVPRKIVLFSQKHHCFITLYTRKDAMAVFHFLFRYDTGSHPPFIVSWGKEYWMKKDEYDERIGKCIISPEVIPPNIIVNFDNSYVYVEDLNKIYGIPVPVIPMEQPIPQMLSPHRYDSPRDRYNSYSPSRDYREVRSPPRNSRERRRDH
ncbi:hypothetical protein KM1_068670 [Entamoeba histolytica HM-3:IMSS]|uniref:RRM domain-containing protein n=6 Tax=Entamoeba histolytica TaxID=5759 RepID=C4LTB1_ENTH1|nr:hypothetical protein EHI_044920 [Entamoeba histolytica HM-1:IMSS]EMD44195.1 Hypothetical protein EHI5A_051730 [Entamoeba histolytica KU27]EMS12112.1 hypothetical protein KM1_068670 [Entamoeba histolytica HM-3:IMSS]ENY61889.1 hypothetical protein EHI7A_034460 [Entamoeba histolytica HM-1:IMSS-A]GAT91789.1 hypothetical protein CL6EHI_044920 [Entamoeba histolytica]EAL51824.1 hypothetical protein EHI_044920 [Entamoeba histolytica HM-1:IMSS]|eukprot:XP_657203.1 hypothetical protein EHI_044920 [Entamoeba histolytica HM-1:IMSS]